MKKRVHSKFQALVELSPYLNELKRVHMSAWAHENTSQTNTVGLLLSAEYVRTQTNQIEYLIEYWVP